MKITFEYEGQKYELEFTANSIKAMDRKGFDFTNMDKHPLTLGEDLFVGAFIAHHPTVPEKKRKEIFNSMAGSYQEITETLVKMVSESLEDITKPNKGNTQWEII